MSNALLDAMNNNTALNSQTGVNFPGNTVSWYGASGREDFSINLGTQDEPNYKSIKSISIYPVEIMKHFAKGMGEEYVQSNSVATISDKGAKEYTMEGKTFSRKSDGVSALGLSNPAELRMEQNIIGLVTAVDGKSPKAPMLVKIKVKGLLFKQFMDAQNEAKGLTSRSVITFSRDGQTVKSKATNATNEVLSVTITTMDDFNKFATDNGDKYQEALTYVEAYLDSDSLASKMSAGNEDVKPLTSDDEVEIDADLDLPF